MRCHGHGPTCRPTNPTPLCRTAGEHSQGSQKKHKNHHRHHPARNLSIGLLIERCGSSSIPTVLTPRSSEESDWCTRGPYEGCDIAPPRGELIDDYWSTRQANNSESSTLYSYRITAYNSNSLEHISRNFVRNNQEIRDSKRTRAAAGKRIVSDTQVKDSKECSIPSHGISCLC